MNTPTFFFYDLETSGLDPRKHRIMQFAGQRTNMALEKVGEPLNIIVKLSPEVLPNPGAIMVTGITPQYTLDEGMPEREAMRRIIEEAFTPDTIVVGFNNIRFDDEFIRYSAYRNFYDPYEWAYADGRSRWDILDIVRLVRALRPDGITWPVDEHGAPINTLERIASANGVEHLKAHDAMSDVEALIAITRLIRNKQPKMYQYLLDGRGKEAVGRLVSPTRPEPFIYSSGSLGKANIFTTVAYPVGYGDNKKVIVYDLRHDPTPYLKLSVDQLREIRFTKWEERQKPDYLPLPAKEITTNKCPAVAPFATLRPEDAKRLGIDLATVKQNLEILVANNFSAKLQEVFVTTNKFPKTADVDAALYDGFVNAQTDKSSLLQIRRADISTLGLLKPQFEDNRLPELFIRYKGRNAPETLSAEEKLHWEAYASARKAADMPGFKQTMAIMGLKASDDKRILLAKLEQWAKQTK
jgi:exodeoxyribonuclease-1